MIDGHRDVLGAIRQLLMGNNVHVGDKWSIGDRRNENAENAHLRATVIRRHWGLCARSELGGNDVQAEKKTQTGRVADHPTHLAGKEDNL